MQRLSMYAININLPFKKGDVVKIIMEDSPNKGRLGIVEDCGPTIVVVRPLPISDNYLDRARGYLLSEVEKWE